MNRRKEKRAMGKSGYQKGVIWQKGKMFKDGWIERMKVNSKKNKAGYTTISCGRMGRGGNATVRN